MARSVIILLLIIVIALVVFKALDKNAGAQESSEMSQLLDGQKAILEKLDIIENKLDTIKTRIH